MQHKIEESIQKIEESFAKLFGLKVHPDLDPNILRVHLSRYQFSESIPAKHIELYDGKNELLSGSFYPTEQRKRIS